MHIWHVMLWEFCKNAPETAKEVCSVYYRGVITDFQVRNWISKLFPDEYKPLYSSDLDQDTLRELVGCNPRKRIWDLRLGFSTSQFAISRHLKKMKKFASWAFRFLVLFIRIIWKIDDTYEQVIFQVREMTPFLRISLLVWKLFLSWCATQKAVGWQEWIPEAYSWGGVS